MLQYNGQAVISMLFDWIPVMNQSFGGIALSVALRYALSITTPFNNKPSKLKVGSWKSSYGHGQILAIQHLLCISQLGVHLVQH
jgi:hypothetical protein